VKQAHLGVGDLRQRLALDAHELQEGDERKPGREHGRGVAQHLDPLSVMRSTAVAGRPSVVRTRSMSAGRLQAGVGDGLLERVGRPRRREQPLQVAEREPAAVAGRADLVERVAAPAHPATSRACATASSVHVPSYCGTSPRASHRRNVAGVVPVSRATCAAYGGRSSTVGLRSR